MLRSIPEGRALLNSMILMGRSMNLVLMMAVQNPDVLLPKSGKANDDLAANMGWFFIGYLTSADQVAHAVRLLGLTDGYDYRERFQAFENGRGYLRDPLGRMGEVQIDVVPSSLLHEFGTTPGRG